MRLSIQRLSLSVGLALAFVLPVAAGYAIDDSSSGVIYSCTGSGTFENYGEYSSVVETSDAWNSTVHVNWKSTPCTIEINFVGHGITFYVLNIGGFQQRANAWIEGAKATAYSLPYAATATCANNISFCGPSNVSLFDIQELPDYSHKLTVTLDNPVFFDYAFVNNDGSSTPSPEKSSTNVGAIVGGVIAGLVFLAALMALYLFFIRRRRRRNNEYAANLDPSPEEHSTLVPAAAPAMSFSTQSPSPVSPVNDSHTARLSDLSYAQISPLSLQHTPVTFPSPVHQSDFDHSQPWTGDNLDPPPYSTNIPTSPTQPHHATATTETTPTGSTHPFPTAHVPSSPPRTATASQAELSDEDIRFVHSLHADNIPASTIARLIAEMTASRQQKADGSGPNTSAKKGLSPA